MQHVDVLKMAALGRLRTFEIGPHRTRTVLPFSTSALKVMNLKTISAGSLLLVLSAQLPLACAVCLDPRTGKSGYKVPLETEVRTAEAIVIGRVLSEQPLQEDADDPDGVTASNVTIKVLGKLKGRLPSVIVARNENTSSRYSMSVGEEHILFVSRTHREWWIDSCGNSALMPRGEQIVQEIPTQLRAVK
jgi:hypothetical protein